MEGRRREETSFQSLGRNLGQSSLSLALQSAVGTHVEGLLRGIIGGEFTAD